MKPPHRHRPGHRLARFLLTLATAAFLMVPAAAAQAHDVLEASDPANGSAVGAVPAKIGLTFNHTPIAIGSVVRVQDATGTDQADGPVSIVDNHVTQPVKTGAPDGKYTVVWRVVSSDGHPIEGSFTFTAGGENTADAARPSPSAVQAGTGGALQAGLITAEPSRSSWWLGSWRSAPSSSAGCASRNPAAKRPRHRIRDPGHYRPDSSHKPVCSGRDLR